MARTIDKILEVKKVERIILSEAREFEYDYDETKMLVEIANVFNKLLNEDKILSISRLGGDKCKEFSQKKFAELQYLVTNMLRRDPIGAYVKVKRIIRMMQLQAEKANPQERYCIDCYINNALLPIQRELENTQLIKSVKDKLVGYKIGNRELYRKIFHPLIRPNFMLTRYMSMAPKNGQLIERYKVGDTLVEIFKVPGNIRLHSHVTPPEFRLSDVKYTILDSARRYLAEHKPTETEFTHPERAREIFKNIGKDMISEMARGRNVNLTAKELEMMANILARYTAGFGILEVLLEDENIQDVYINSPIGLMPIYVGHSVYEECETNLIPTKEDAEGWATRFRMLSGRPLDEANPVLDTELLIPGGRARVCAITRTLSPEGIGYALRRHRDRPWTYPLFMDVKFFDPLFAGLMSFLVDGSRTLLIGGTRSSGKTALLGATMLEIMKRFRICTVEDSVTGDSRIFIRRNGKIEKTTIGNVIDGLFKKYNKKDFLERDILRKEDIDEKIEILAYDNKGKQFFKPISCFIRHKVEKPIYEIETATGRKIKVTGDHSLFTIGEKKVLREIKTSNLTPGDFIAVPRKLILENKPKKTLNILDYSNQLKDLYVSGKYLGIKIKENWQKVKEISKELNYSKSCPSTWKRKIILPIEVFSKLNIKNSENLRIAPKLRKGNEINSEIDLDEDFLTFIGLWIADGCYDKRSVIISVAENECRELVKRVANKFGLKTKMHSDGFSLIINSTVLKAIMKDALYLRGDAYTKEIPEWIFNLSKKQISWVLKGIFSGDGCVGKKEIVIPLASDKLLYDLQSLLLIYEIILRRSNKRRKDKTFNASISTVNDFLNFKNNIGFLTEKKENKLEELCKKISTHDTSDIIPLSLTAKKELNQVLPKFNYYDYITRNNNIGRRKLQQLVTNSNIKLNPLNDLAESDIFWDKIINIKKLKEEENYVYDISVPECENFVCENIIAHNTLELPVTQLRNMGYNIERLKARSVITRVEAELPADEALRTALRLGDSCLIIGEVRSKEAKALWEAMRIGALANVVAGTIHGESAYGVFDRVVNDLGVPKTSFKATDIVVICNRLRSADGLRTFRRVVEVTEVRKHWQEDPMDENGFVNLMEYSAKEDKLKPTGTLLNGESFIINEIAKRVKEWHGDWNAVWSNIELRGKIKQAMVDYANKLNRKDILEAEWTSKSNEMFHTIADKVHREIGALDSKEIYKRWDEWFRNELKHKK